ncbi:MAG: single-stranded DNA-binding protein [Alphaproteobacteria bacterium]|nr:single-stranded DNA-binding protein [Alphaproteobacteria bacterium]
MYINKVQVLGNLTRDPELKQLPSGIQVCNMAVATNRVYKDKNGQKQEEVEYHNVVLFGRTAEVAGQYLKKGSSVYVEGRLRTNSWETDGIKKYKTEIVGEQMQLGPRKQGDGTSSTTPQGATKTSTVDDYQEPAALADEIPF